MRPTARPPVISEAAFTLVVALALVCGPSLSVAQDTTAAGAGSDVTVPAAAGGDAPKPRIDIALDRLEGKLVHGADGAEFGEIVDLVRPAGRSRGLYAVVATERGEDEAVRRMVVALDRITVTGEDRLRLERFPLTQAHIQRR